MSNYFKAPENLEEKTNTGDFFHKPGDLNKESNNNSFFYTPNDLDSSANKTVSSAEEINKFISEVATGKRSEGLTIGGATMFVSFDRLKEMVNYKIVSILCEYLLLSQERQYLQEYIELVRAFKLRYYCLNPILPMHYKLTGIFYKIRLRNLASVIRVLYKNCK